ncbi:MAG: ATP-binding protein, partial [Dehalococcoidia bacterium]|nr:ATP-binding protein [Dehalococcoidia bacterium]
IVAGANCLEHWLSEMQDLMKSETGLLEVKLETVAPLTVLHEVAFVCLPMIALKKQSLILDLPSSLPRVRADVERLQEILLNLLTNGSRFTSEKGEIVLRARAKSGEVTIEVQDNGIGISQEKREHLFESRFRTRSQQSEGHKGLGLGLAVCKQLVQQHGGRIWVDSEPGRGSTFAFTLPVEEGSIEGLSN